MTKRWPILEILQKGTAFLFVLCAARAQAAPQLACDKSLFDFPHFAEAVLTGGADAQELLNVAQLRPSFQASLSARIANDLKATSRWALFMRSDADRRTLEERATRGLRLLEKINPDLAAQTAVDLMATKAVADRDAAEFEFLAYLSRLALDERAAPRFVRAWFDGVPRVLKLRLVRRDFRFYEQMVAALFRVAHGGQTDLLPRNADVDSYGSFLLRVFKNEDRQKAFRVATTMTAYFTTAGAPELQLKYTQELAGLLPANPHDAL